MESNIDWLITWIMITSIGTAVMALAVLLTGIIAWIKLFGITSSRREDNSRLLLKIWYADGYNKDLKFLSDNYYQYFLSENHIDENTLEEIEKSQKFTDYISRIRNFISKINYYLKRKKTNIECISFDFSEIFYINYLLSSLQLYRMLKSYEKKYGSGGQDYTKDIFSIDLFFLEIAGFNKNDDFKQEIVKGLYGTNVPDIDE